MQIEIKVPEVGESVREGVLAQWFRHDGETVRKGELLFLLETDKITLEISAEADGILKIRVPEGAVVAVGAVVAILEAVPADAKPGKREEPELERQLETPPSAQETPKVAPVPESVAASEGPVAIAPSAQRLMEEKGIGPSSIRGTGPGGRITQGDVLLFLESSGAPVPPETLPPKTLEHPKPQPRVSDAPSAIVPTEALLGEETIRKPMSPIRQRIAERLVAAKQNTATLTTFNDVDMSRIQEIRGRFKDAYRERYGISLGIMSFFVKASVEALKAYPEVNAFIDGKDIVYHNYFHIGVAVGAERGLVVPVIRHADRLTFAEIERSIADYVHKIKENRLELSDLEGGTFTITNGGVFGSLLSTPLLNFPQSAILGMHRIDNRPVAVGSEVAVRPVMYVAMT
ncbi:MAG: dihydrolipoyllysine-residue succinyltransferase, partial [Syntrophobacteraceae bacterium]|nr:dihydrolipoyllysine-residue succinyltransferase [Syntrophobacteraceae bacterium]